nr:hypothetical protein CFP56_11345 [Quercus suber]
MPVQQKPMLPPRQGGNSSSVNHSNSFVNIDDPAEAPPVYGYGNLTNRNPKDMPSWPAQDLRTSSQHSLVPSESNVQHQRRRLLLIYVHGFMGNETSFRSFPAHVHHLLTVLLADTHVVHTKIYPRYRSRKNISFARDNFSEWLEPHEHPKTDVVLLGHSMGGLLCSEVVLKPSTPPAPSPFAHRILGTINFDVPFLGMHPGVVRSGLASIFKPAEETHQDEYKTDLERTTNSEHGSTESFNTTNSTVRRSDTLWQPDFKDPNFDTPFPNDVKLPKRTGWESAWHFLSKHSKDLKGATKNLVSSHMEFGGAMANYGELKSRYGRIRILEEQSADVRKSLTDSKAVPARVRFINYYTASTGRPKKQKPFQDGEMKLVPSNESALVSSRTSQFVSSDEERQIVDAGPQEAKVPEIIADANSDELDAAAESLTIGVSRSDMQVLEPDPVADTEDHEATAMASGGNRLDTSAKSTVPSLHSTASNPAPLPALPDLPPAPPPLDVSFIQDAATRKMVEKEHARATKAYEKAVKEREKSIAEWRKLEQKREKNARQAAEKADKDAAKADLLAAKAKEKENLARAKDAARTASTNKTSQPERAMTHKEQEELRLMKEKERMEAEALRMSGKQKDDVQLGQDQTVDPVSSTISNSLGDASSSASLNQEEDESVSEDLTQRGNAKASKPLKDRMFCSLPPKDANGQLDPCWVRIFMKDVDEVGAHCGLFFVDERYERLVGEVADRIEAWVGEDMDTRAVLEALNEGLD